MFANRDEALAMATRFFRVADSAQPAFLLDEKGYWLVPQPPAGAVGEALIARLQEVRPQIAGWLRRAEEGANMLFTFGEGKLFLLAVEIEGETGLRALAIVLTQQGFDEAVPSTETLLSQVDGIAFATDGSEARSRGHLGSVQGSNWQPESWYELWTRLLILTLEADALPSLAKAEPVRLIGYSLSLCRFVEVSAGKAGAGIAGWFRLPAKAVAAKVSEELFSFFTYAGNPSLQFPLALNNPVAMALSVHLATQARREWTRYLAEAGQTQTPLQFQAEFESGQALFTVQVSSELVYGPRGALVGHHHVAYLVPDPILSFTHTTTSSSNTAVEEAETLTREANHRIKNSLSMAASLLQLQSYALEDQAAKDALVDSVQRLYTVSDLHEALYKYTSGTARQVQMQPFLGSIVDRLQALIAGQGIEVRAEIQELELDSKLASRIGLLVNELVLNAAKYAFPGQKQGFVAIYLTKSGTTYYLSVQDNGQGMEARTSSNTASLGHTLITEFAKQLHADMRLETQAGTRYVFTFSA